MRTTLDLDQELLEQAMKDTGAPTKTAAIEMGLQALVRRAAWKYLMDLGGKIPDAWSAPRRRSAPRRPRSK